MTVLNTGITGQRSGLAGAKKVFPGFEVALRWLVGGLWVAWRWLSVGFGVALGWLCTPESMPSICVVYGLGVALGGLSVQGSGFRVQGSGFRVQGSGFRVQGSRFEVLPISFVHSSPARRTAFLPPDFRL